MGLRERIKSILASKALTMTYVAQEMTKRLGKNMSLDNLSKKSKHETLTYRELQCIADIAGYDIEFIEKGKGN